MARRVARWLAWFAWGEIVGAWAGRRLARYEATRAELRRELGREPTESELAERLSGPTRDEWRESDT